MEVKGHQRSNLVIYVPWLPYLVKRIADASYEWWWPSRRSKVIRGQMWSTMLPNLVGRAADASLGWLWPSWMSKANRGQIQWIIYVLPIWYLVSGWGLGPKVCIHHFGCGMIWIKGYYMIVKVKNDFNLLISNLFNGNAFLTIVILYYLPIRRDVWFKNHLVLYNLYKNLDFWEKFKRKSIEKGLKLKLKHFTSYASNSTQEILCARLCHAQRTHCVCCICFL